MEELKDKINENQKRQVIQEEIQESSSGSDSDSEPSGDNLDPKELMKILP